MNKLSIGTALAALCVTAAMATPALAQTVPVPPVSQRSNTTTPSAKPAKKPRRALPAPDSPNCLLYTGSHIRPPRGHCLPVTGLSFGQQDIQRTGAMNLGEALQMLVPSATIHD